MKAETKGKIKGMIAGSIATALIVGGGVIAAQRSKKIEVFYDDIQLYVDGFKVNPTDANGTKVEPFIYNGTTYLPVRAVGKAIGKDVTWDGQKKIVYLGDVPGQSENWLTQCPPYQTSGRMTKYTSENGKYFVMSGKKYTDGYVSDTPGKAYALFNLNGKYNKFEFTVGHVDSDNRQLTASLNIYLDGKIAYSTKLYPTDLARRISIPLNGALQMKIDLSHSYDMMSNSGSDYGIAEGRFE